MVSFNGISNPPNSEGWMFLQNVNHTMHMSHLHGFVAVFSSVKEDLIFESSWMNADMAAGADVCRISVVIGETGVA